MPTVAEVTLSVIVGEVTLLTAKLADAESLPGFPVAVIVYVPGLVEAIVKLPLSAPLAIEHVEERMGVPESVHDESPVRKLDPVTSTVAPCKAEVGFSVIDGGRTETTKLADAASPVGLPVAVIW